MEAFCEWCFRQNEDVIIVNSGHSIWFQQFFRAYIPKHEDHISKEKKIQNCGVIVFTLSKGCRIGTSAQEIGYRVNQESIRVLYGDFVKGGTRKGKRNIALASIDAAASQGELTNRLPKAGSQARSSGPYCVNGRWTMKDIKDENKFHYDWRHVAGATSFAGEQTGVGKIDDGQIEGNNIRWISGDVRCEGELMNNGSQIQKGKYFEIATGCQRGAFTGEKIEEAKSRSATHTKNGASGCFAWCGL
jgi:hypothetical protein